MNDFLSLAQKRYAVRSYLPKPVEAEKLERILEAGRVAPTAKNTQPFRFLVVQHPERLKKLSACTNVKGYPLAIIVCSVASEVWVRPFDGKKARHRRGDSGDTHAFGSDGSGLGQLLAHAFRSRAHTRAIPHPRRDRA